MNTRQISLLRLLSVKISVVATCLILLGATPASLRACTITVTSTGDNGPGTLRAALASVSSGCTVDVTSVVGTILLTSGQLVVTNSVSIIGPGDNALQVNGNLGSNLGSRVFYIGSNTTATIAGLTITQGNSLGTPAGGGIGFGGGIYNAGTLVITNCIVSDNYSAAGCAGGGIYNVGTLTVSATLLSSNVAYEFSIEGSDGGGIFSAGTLTVIGSTLNGNTAEAELPNILGAGGPGNGGGIFSQASMTITNCIFINNTATSIGGGIYNYGGTGTVSASTLSSNSAARDGGIDNYNSGVLSLINCTLSSNVASNGAGGIENQATMTVTNCTFDHNSTGKALPASSGGIINFGVLTVSSSTLSDNSGVSGGGILNLGTLTVTACTLSGNSTTNGGGICNAGSSASMQIGNTILNGGGSGVNITNANGGTLVSQGYNLSSDAAGGDDHNAGPGGLLNATGDIRNTDPMLGPLANNGGLTFTHALLPGSSATDQGNSFGLTTDQRGFPRPVNDSCIANATGGDGSDIGAFEVQQVCQPFAFEITAIERIGTGNDLRLSYATVLGSNCVVQTSSNMVSGSWTSLPGTNVGIGVVMQSIITNALAAPEGFYRIQQLP